LSSSDETPYEPSPPQIQYLVALRDGTSLKRWASAFSMHNVLLREGLIRRRTGQLCYSKDSPRFAITDKGRRAVKAYG